MICFNHKVKIITHLVVEHHDWVEYKMVAEEIKEAREEVKRVLKPGQHPGGPKQDNIGVAYDCPDPRVEFKNKNSILFLFIVISILGFWRDHTNCRDG